MSIIPVSKSKEFNDLISNGACIVGYATTSCVACQKVGPVYAQLAKENSNIKFMHVNIDNAFETMQNELKNITKTPYFEFYFNGKKLHQFFGADLNEINDGINLLKSHLAKKKISSLFDLVEVNDSNELAKLISKGRSFVFYTSADAPQSAKLIEQTISDYAFEHPNIKFIKIDTNKFDGLTNFLRLPYFELYFNGEKILNFYDADLEKIGKSVDLLNSNLETSRKDFVKISRADELSKYQREKSFFIYTAKWCQPSEAVLPALREIAAKNSSIIFIKIDLDEARNNMPIDVEHVKKLPFFEIFNNGKKIVHFYGNDVSLINENLKLLN